MLAHIRDTLQTYSDRTGRPIDEVKRWFRRLDDRQQDRAFRNIEAANARKASGIVGAAEHAASGLILPGGDAAS